MRTRPAARPVTTITRTVAGAVGGALVAFGSLILAVAVGNSGPGRRVSLGDTYLGLIVCITAGPAFGLALAHLGMRRPPADPPKK